MTRPTDLRTEPIEVTPQAAAQPPPGTEMLRPHRSAVVVAAAAAFVVLAVLSAGAPVTGALFAGFAVAVVPVAVYLIRRPAVAAGVLATVTVTGIEGPLARQGLPGVPLLVLVIAAVAAVRVVVNRSATFRWSPVYLAGAAWLLSQTAATVGSSNVGLSLSTLTTYFLSALLLVSLVTLCSVTSVLPTVLRSVVLGVSVMAALTIVQQATGNSSDFGGLSLVAGTTLFGMPRHSGPLSDPNFWGRVLVLLLPLSVWAASVARRLRVMWWSCPVALLGALLLTGSRGAVVAFVAMAPIALVLGGRRARQFFGLCLIAALGLLAIPAVSSSVMELLPLGQATRGVGDPSLVGRVEAQRYGLQLALANPVDGVGPDNFVREVDNYRQHYGTSSSGPSLAAHNVYLQMAAESGVFGLAAWLLLGGTVMFVGVRSALVLRKRDGREVMDTAAAALVAGLFGWGVASLFLHLNQLATLAVVMALTVAVDQRVELPQPDVDEEPGALPVDMTARRQAALAAGVVVLVLEILLVPAAWATALATSSTTYRATATVAVTPRSAEITSYDVDVSSRPDVTGTFAELIELTPEEEGQYPIVPEGVRLDVFPTPGTSVITVSADAPTPSIARRVLIERATAADAFLASTGSFYRLERSSAVQIQPQDHTFEVLVPLLALGQLPCVVAAFVTRRVVDARVRRTIRRVPMPR